MARACIADQINMSNGMVSLLFIHYITLYSLSVNEAFVIDAYGHIAKTRINAKSLLVKIDEYFAIAQMTHNFNVTWL